MVGKVCTGIAYEVEIDSVEIIASDKLKRNVHKVLSHLRLSRIQPSLSINIIHPCSEPACRMGWNTLPHRRRPANLEHIEPGVYFESRVMSFRQKERQRIPSGIFAQRAGEVFSPGF